MLEERMSDVPSYNWSDTILFTVFEAIAKT
jgi:hypothetical protein